MRTRKIFIGQELSSLSVLQTMTGLKGDALVARWEEENRYNERPSKRPPGNPEIAKEQRRLSCWRPSRRFEQVAYDHYTVHGWLHMEVAIAHG